MMYEDWKFGTDFAERENNEFTRGRDARGSSDIKENATPKLKASRQAEQICDGGEAKPIPLNESKLKQITNIIDKLHVSIKML